MKKITAFLLATTISLTAAFLVVQNIQAQIDVGVTQDPGGSGVIQDPGGSGIVQDPGGSGTTQDPGGSGVTQTTITNPLSSGGKEITSLCQLISIILNIITEIGAIVAVLFIIWSGFLFIKAQGNPEEIKKAKSTFYTTIIGTAVLLGASVITKIILTTISNLTGAPGGAC